MSSSVRRIMTIVAASMALLLIGSAAMAHECYNASRMGKNGDVQAGTKSQTWFHLTIEDIIGFDIADGFYDEEDAPCVLAEWNELGGPSGFSIKVKGANGQDGVVAGNAPESATSDGRGIDHLSDSGVFGLYEQALVNCGIELPVFE